MIERELEDWEFPEPDDDADDGTETCPCSECGAVIYEDAEQCPICGAYVVHRSGRALAGRPWWYVLLALVGVAATIFWLAM